MTLTVHGKRGEAPLPARASQGPGTRPRLPRRCRAQ
jgi:hypothetical protein